MSSSTKRQFPLQPDSKTSHLLAHMRAHPDKKLSTSDIRTILGSSEEHAVADVVRTLMKRKDIRKLKRGVYMLRSPKVESAKKKPETTGGYDYLLKTMELEPTRVFSAKDFSSSGKLNKDINQGLSRLSDRGLVKRVDIGRYQLVQAPHFAPKKRGKKKLLHKGSQTCRDAILAAMDAEPQKVFLIKDLVYLCGVTKSKVFDTLKELVREEAVLRMGRGEYIRGGRSYSSASSKKNAEVGEEMDEVNVALSRANSHQDALKKIVFDLVGLFERLGKKINKITFNRGPDGKVTSYTTEAVEVEEVSR